MNRPKKEDVLDYICFLANTGKAPKSHVADLLKISRNRIQDRAERGALWADHFLSDYKTKITEINASDIENFDLENISIDRCYGAYV